MKEESYWILVSKKIAGEATAEELELLRKLTSENPEWETTMENLQDLWNSKPLNTSALKKQKIEDAYLSHVNRLKEKADDFLEPDQIFENDEVFNFPDKKKPLYARAMTYLIAVFFIGGIFLLYSLTGNSNKAPLQVESEPPINEIAVSPGLKSKIQLPDGSQVWINSDSKLTYGKAFTGNTREVFLEGEAYFEVTKDAAHPFIVHTSGIDIKVLGTAFNIKAYKVDPTIEATLIHGSIEVVNKNQPGSSKIMMKPHEKLVYNKYPLADKKDQRADLVPQTDAYSITIRPLKKNIADSNIVETAWVYNKLIFDDERMEDLATKMEKWFNLKISIESDKLKNYRVTGSFINETAEEALKELQFLMPFSYSLKGNAVKIMRK